MQRRSLFNSAMDGQVKRQEQAALSVAVRVFRAIFLALGTLLLVYGLIQFLAALLLAGLFSTLGYSPAEPYFPQGHWLGAAARLWLCWSFPEPFQTLYASRLACTSLLDTVEKTIEYAQMGEGPPFDVVLYYQLPTVSPIFGVVAALLVAFTSLLRKPRKQ